MFTVEIAKSKGYQKVSENEIADKAIHFFIDTVDHPDAAKGIRLMRGDEVMARKTPKTIFIAPEWR